MIRFAVMVAAGAVLACAIAPAAAIDLFGGRVEPDAAQWKTSPKATEAQIRALGFDAGVVDRLTTRTGAPAEILPGRGSSSPSPIGLVWPTGSAGADEVVRQERNELAGQGYVIFVAERAFGTEPDRVAVVRAADRLAPITLQGTSGPNVGVSTGDIVERLRAWERQAPFDLLGAGSDWVELELRSLPAKLDAFVEDVRNIAPDSLGREPESLAALRAEIERSRRVFLWWD